MTSGLREQELLLQLLTRTSILAGHCSMALAEAGALTDTRATETANELREIAKIYEEFGNDRAAAEFWTTATLVEQSGEPGD